MSRMPHNPVYTLHPPFPVRRVLWRPSYECEVVVVSNAKFGAGPSPDYETTSGSKLSLSTIGRNPAGPEISEAVEIWDVRRGWLPKWSISGSTLEGGVTGGRLPEYLL